MPPNKMQIHKSFKMLPFKGSSTIFFFSSDSILLPLSLRKWSQKHPYYEQVHRPVPVFTVGRTMHHFQIFPDGFVVMWLILGRGSFLNSPIEPFLLWLFTETNSQTSKSLKVLPDPPFLLIFYRDTVGPRSPCAGKGRFWPSLRPQCSPTLPASTSLERLKRM